MPATLFEVNNITKISDFSRMYGTERTVPFGFLTLSDLVLVEMENEEPNIQRRCK